MVHIGIGGVESTAWVKMYVNQKYDDQNDNNVKTVEDENHNDDKNEESNHNIISTDHFQNKIE